MSPVEAILRDCGLAAGIGFWRFDARRGLLHWPRGFGPARDGSYGAWVPLGEFGLHFLPADRARLFDWFDHIIDVDVAHPPLELPIATPDGRIQLRIEGSPLEAGDLLAAGLVRNISRRHEAEDRARNLTQILDALLEMSPAGIIVINGKGAVRKANALAFGLFGLDGGAASPKALEARFPAGLSAEVAACVGRKTRIDGTVTLEGRRLTWHASPWGRTGTLLVVEPVSPGAVAPVEAPPPVRGPAAVDSSRTLLDYVGHPCLVIQTRDATIDFANASARDKLGLKPGARTHINNLFELSGRHPPHHHYVTAERAQQLVTLPMGARVTRMSDVDPDLLFVEYI